MKTVYIKSQEEFNRIKKVESEEEFIIQCEVRIGFILEVFGKIRFEFKTDCSWLENRFIRARENSSVVAWGNSSVVARENSSVVAWENSSVVARGNSSVEAWGNSSVVARENSSVVAWGNSSVEARENSSVVAWGNSSVEARGNSSVVAWGNSSVRLFTAIKKLLLYGFSVCFKPFDLKFKIEKKSKHVCIQKIKPLDWFERNALEKKQEIILYKKVSKDFKTQEGTSNETLWIIGSIVICKNWHPKDSECGVGKFHACSRPYFCDEFRNVVGDRYIAVEIDLKDVYEWKKNPQYPHKIGFRQGKVLFECDKFGKKI